MAKQYKLTFGRKMVNRLVRSMARKGKGPASELHVRGRSTGTTVSVMVTPVHVDDTTYLVAPYGVVSWVRNIRNDPHVSLSKGGATARYRAVEIDGEEAGHALARYYAENGKYVADFMDVPGDKTITDFTAVADQYPVFRLESVS